MPAKTVAVSSEPPGRVVLVDINLTVGDWFYVILKMTFAAFLAGIVLAIPVVIILAILRVGSTP